MRGIEVGDRAGLGLVGKRKIRTYAVKYSKRHSTAIQFFL